MLLVDDGAMQPRGEALLRELLCVHAGIRNNLKTIAFVPGHWGKQGPAVRRRKPILADWPHSGCMVRLIQLP